MSILEVNSIKCKGKLASGRWVLCLGAGVSFGLVPTWMELARRVINNVFSESYTETDFTDIVNSKGWSLDSWIQSAANEYVNLGKTKEDFVTLLETELYKDIRNLARNDGLEHDLVQALNSPRHVRKDAVFGLCDFFDKHFQGSTLLTLADLLITAHENGKSPHAIITFNAETLLETIVELKQRKAHYEGPEPHSHPEYFLRPVLRAFTGVPHTVIPVFHIHGAIKPRDKNIRYNLADARDRLVFLEEEYFHVATNASSWPETLFMYQSQTNNLVFIGLSMSDPNIRRWLGTGYKIAKDDLDVISSTPISKFVSQHYWLTTKSNSKTVDAVSQVGLAHLGVKPLWLDSWGDLKSGLNNLLSM